MKIAMAGDRALLVSFEKVDALELHAAASRVRRLPAILACIIGHSSLYVICEGRPDAARVSDALAPARNGQRAAERRARRHALSVSFHEQHAPHLPELLTRTGLDLSAFLARIAELPLRARYLGFRAGFAYLDGWPEEWAMPRRATSGPVAAGSFAIAGSVAGFYPIDTPGGWNILGRTNAVLWDEQRDPPNLVAAGDEINILPTLQVVPVAGSPSRRPMPTLPGLEILSAPAATVTGLPEWDRLEHGLAPGGAFDLEAAAMANRAVGNDPGALVLECALAGPRVRATAKAVVSWYGAGTEIRVNGRLVSEPRQFEVAAGDEIAAGRLQDGMRGYLAVGRRRGNVGTLMRGDRLTIHAVPGPHQTGAAAHNAVPLIIECQVSSRLDRVGIRLSPIQKLPIDAPADLLSCGMQCGTVQLHPDGGLVAMGPDHPVTGGYLQPMTVIASDRWKLAQLVPGDRVRFAAQSP